MSLSIPVITIDGSSGSGKGTIAQKLAAYLGWHYLDSGAIYRAVAWALMAADIDLADHEAVKTLIQKVAIEMPVSTRGEVASVIVNNQDVTIDIRSVACSKMASQTSALPFVRDALMDRQRAMRQAPGLVTDGRDMGTVVFPDATVKFFFKASVGERAKRRYNQLKGLGKHVSLPDVERELRKRDERDSGRAVAPLKPASDAILVDTSDQDIAGVFETVLAHVQQSLET